MSSDGLNGWRVALIFGGTLTLASIVLELGNLLNFGFDVSYVNNIDTPGTLWTRRFGILWWALYFHILTLLTLAGFAIVRYVRVQNRVAYGGHIVTCILFLIMSIFLVVMQGLEINGCNTTALNMCTEPRFCCLSTSVLPSAEIVEGCPLLLNPCSTPIVAGDLTWNPPFLWLFVLTIVGFVVGVCHLVAGIYIPAEGDDHISKVADISPIPLGGHQRRVMGANGSTYSNLPNIRA